MNGKHLVKLGLEKKAIALAQTAATTRETAGLSRDDILSELRAVQHNPAAYAAGGVYAPLAAELLAQQAVRDARKGSDLRPAPSPTPPGVRT